MSLARSLFGVSVRRSFSTQSPTEIPFAPDHVRLVIKLTHSNIFVNAVDQNQRSLVVASAGTVGYKNRKRTTPAAYESTVLHVGKKLAAKGINKVGMLINVQGSGKGRHSLTMGLQLAGLGLEYVKMIDTTPHGGCRLPKHRRL